MERYQNNKNQWFAIKGNSEDICKRTVQFDTGYSYDALVSQIRNAKYQVMMIRILARAVNNNNWKYFGFWWRKRNENLLYEKRI